MGSEDRDSYKDKADLVENIAELSAISGQLFSRKKREKK
jgi:hypothetical protein